MLHLQVVHIPSDFHLLVSNHFIRHTWVVGVKFKPLSSHVCHKTFIEQWFQSQVAIERLLWGDVEDRPSLILYHVISIFLGWNIYHQSFQSSTKRHFQVLVHVCTDKVTRNFAYPDVAYLVCINDCRDYYGLCGHCGGSCVFGHRLFVLFPSICICSNLNCPVPLNLKNIRYSSASCFWSLVRC